MLDGNKRKKMTLSADVIKKVARLNRATIVGIAPVDRFEMAPQEFHPKDIFVDARSVIVIGKYFPMGLLKGASKAAMTKAIEIAFDSLDRCAYEVSCFIEKTGEQALPVPADRPYLSWNPVRQHGRGDLSHKHAAVLAGLGSLGKNSLLLTPQYGNRVNLVSIITSIALEGDVLFEPDLCIRKCDLCIKACPGNAIKKDGKVSQLECRKYHTITTPRGFNLFACWECRKVCPVSGNSKLELKAGPNEAGLKS